MKRLPTVLLAVILPFASAGAQQVSMPPEKAADLEATEGLLVQEITAHRNSDAKAIVLTRLINSMTTDHKKQVDDLTAALKDAQDKLQKAEQTAAAAKAIPPPHVNH